MSLYTHTLRVLPIHFGRETVPSGCNPLITVDAPNTAHAVRHRRV